MNAESLARIDAFLSSAVSQLFASYGLPVEAVEFKAPDFAAPFAATIGFTSGAFLGCLVLTMDRAVVESTLPANIKKPRIADEIIADWTGELSNQILGRLKSRLCAAGLDITLSTPTVFTGNHLKHLICPTPLHRRVLFQGGGTILVEFQADFGEDFEIGEEGEGESSPPEGEALFF